MERESYLKVLNAHLCVPYDHLIYGKACLMMFFMLEVNADRLIVACSCTGGNKLPHSKRNKDES